MEEREGYYTLQGYRLLEMEDLTFAMEDYLEMICRLLQRGETARVSELAEQLHVKPSSASRMARNLSEAGYVDFPRYGCLTVTEKGAAAGARLLHRHQVLVDFFSLLNGGDPLEQAEKIEHFISGETLRNLEKLVWEMVERRGK